MSLARALLAELSAIGIEVALDGDGLRLRGSHVPSPELIAKIRKGKPAIIAELRRAPAPVAATPDRDAFEEHAAIAEYDGGLPRTKPEARAYECAIVEWLDRNPVSSEPEQCAWCGKAETPDAVMLPFGTETHGHTWLHSACWSAWHDRRRAEAVAALAVIGLGPPRRLPWACRSDSRPK